MLYFSKCLNTRKELRSDHMRPFSPIMPFFPLSALCPIAYKWVLHTACLFAASVPAALRIKVYIVLVETTQIYLVMPVMLETNASTFLFQHYCRDDQTVPILLPVNTFAHCAVRFKRTCTHWQERATQIEFQVAASLSL